MIKERLNAMADRILFLEGVVENLQTENKILQQKVDFLDSDKHHLQLRYNLLEALYNCSKSMSEIEGEIINKLS